MKQYDIIIIGAGPAGAMLSRLCLNKKIAIIDARPLHREYIPGDLLKSCGGLLSPRTQKFLLRNNIKIPNEIIDTEQYDFVKTTDFDINVTRKYKRRYINVNREKFDRFLLDNITAEKYFEMRVNKIEKDGNNFIINDKLSAPILVGADGATSIVRRRLFPNVHFNEYISIQEVFNNKLINGYECYFDKKTGDYYGWSLIKNNKTYFGYLIPLGPDAKTKFNDFKNKTVFKKIIAGTTEGTILTRPSFFHPVTCTENVFLIGEAGGYVSPSSAEGISYALRTAEILAKSDFNVKKLRHSMRKIQFEIFIKKLKSIPMYTPWIRAIILRFSMGK